ncbi:hypothetical protein GGX14DRAFT_544237 [Mycena pura]|uniref:DUF6534 domain-containing protein n=1 Tax=Mycena pura TaxID=153505 RepID=A0AAD6V6I3_9AGAR|nr:hypothetical protein GGX14DRAFT_544237 [Mycena pura]
MAPASSIAHTFSVWLIVLFIQSMYFFWYPKDSWGTKWTVALITVLETLQSVIHFMACYQIFVTSFDNPPALAFISWPPVVQLGALYASTFVAQAFFGHCIYILHQKRLILPVAIAVFALVAFVSQTFESARVKLWADLGSTSPSPVNRTNRMINFLIIMAVNRGVLTMITALINIVLFLAKPGTFYFMLMVVSSGKLYMNNMMAMLNTRQYARSLSEVKSADIHISLPTFTEARAETMEVNGTVTKETHPDQIRKREPGTKLFGHVHFFELNGAAQGYNGWEAGRETRIHSHPANSSKCGKSRRNPAQCPAKEADDAADRIKPGTSLYAPIRISPHIRGGCCQLII